MSEAAKALPRLLKHEPGVVASVAYRNGRRSRDIPIAEAGDWSSRPEHFVWIGLHEPSDELLARVQEQFDLHPLAIEDARNAHQRPKFERYGEALFIVARTAQMFDSEIWFGETHLFVGRGYVVSVRHGPSTSYAVVRERYEASPVHSSCAEQYVLHAILDFIADSYSPVIEAIRQKAELIEDDLLSMKLKRTDIERIYTLRRDLLRLRNSASPLVDICRRLEHDDVLPTDTSVQLLFRDVTDHVHRVQEEINTLREVLAFAFEASMMLGQADQTDTTRRLAAWAAILAVPTAVAGIYGMNFKFMPELDWSYGYFAVLGAIGVICGTLYTLFRRNRWL